MSIGMLWFDNDNSADLNHKIRRAISYYEKKYEKPVTLCYVHPSMFPIKKGVYPVEVRKDEMLMPNYFWLGQKENE